MKYEQAKKLVRKNLSEKRYTHTKNVKKMAVKLAKRWGADPEKAALAAILHDAAKELPKDRQLQIFAENAIIAENAPARPAPVWHGVAAAILAETKWVVTDPEILSAIRCHTTLRAAPSPCDMALFLADKLAWDQPGEPPFRSVIEDSLAVSLEQASLRSIEYVLDHGMILMPHRWLLEALAWLRAHAGSPSDGGAR